MNRLILDTHLVIWTINDASRIAPSVQALISDPKSHVFVSAASAWECAIKVAKGKLRVPIHEWQSELEKRDIVELPITTLHALAAAALPPHHGDPYDRMLVAQARLEGLTLVTHDEALARYDVPILLT